MHRPLRNLVLFLTFVSLTAEEDKNHVTEYGAIGAEVVLKPPTETPGITDVEWQHGGNLVAYLEEGRAKCLGWFEGRCELDPSSGVLTIRELKRNVSGIYTLTINNKKIDAKIQLYVIAPVTKPTVSKSCNTEMTSCNLTCNVKMQEEDHITYRWLADNAIGPENEMFVITKEVEKVWFRCSVVNPVSDEISSDPVRNPFIPDSSLGLGIGITIPLVVVVLIILGLLYAYKQGRFGGRRCCGFPSNNQRGGGKAEAGAPVERESLNPQANEGQNGQNGPAAVPNGGVPAEVGGNNEAGNLCKWFPWPRRTMKKSQDIEAPQVNPDNQNGPGVLVPAADVDEIPLMSVKTPDQDHGSAPSAHIAKDAVSVETPDQDQGSAVTAQIAKDAVSVETPDQDQGSAPSAQITKEAECPVSVETPDQDEGSAASAPLAKVTDCPVSVETPDQDQGSAASAPIAKKAMPAEVNGNNKTVVADVHINNGPVIQEAKINQTPNGHPASGSPSVSAENLSQDQGSAVSLKLAKDAEMPSVSADTPNQDHASAASAQISKSSGNPAEDVSCEEELKEGLPVGDDDTRV